MNAFAFTLIRKHLIKHHHAANEPEKAHHSKTLNRNNMAMGMYALAMLASPISVYISFGLFCIVPVMYVRPKTPLK